jgi:hypothetical protein
MRSQPEINAEIAKMLEGLKAAQERTNSLLEKANEQREAAKQSAPGGMPIALTPPKPQTRQ